MELRSESSHNCIDGLLSMKYIRNVVVIDMTHIIATHVSISKKDDVKRYWYNEDEILFDPCFNRVADPGEPENLTNANEINLELMFS